MIKEKVKAMWQSRVGFGIIMFIIGAFCSYFIVPTKTIVEIKTVVVEKIVEKVVVKYVEKIVTKLEKVKVVKNKITWPDGKIEESEVYESESEQLERLKDTYSELLKESTKQIEEEYKKTTINPKYLNVFVGAKTALNHLDRPNYLVGFSYDVVGPVTIGGIVSNAPDIAVTVGLRF